MPTKLSRRTPSLTPKTEGKAVMPSTSEMLRCFSASTFATRNMPPDLMAAWPDTAPDTPHRKDTEEIAKRRQPGIERYADDGGSAIAICSIRQRIDCATVRIAPGLSVRPDRTLRCSHHIYTAIVPEDERPIEPRHGCLPFTTSMRSWIRPPARPVYRQRP